MKLTSEQKTKLKAIILRFIKDEKLYKYINKNLKNLYMDFTDNIIFIELALSRFAQTNMKISMDLETQARFTKYIEKIQTKTTTQLFHEFLVTQNITLQELMNHLYYLKKMRNINEEEFNKRINVINIYNPHILTALSAYRSIHIKDPFLIRNIKENWHDYYKKNMTLTI